MTEITDNLESVSYRYDWKGVEKEGIVKVPKEMLGLTNNLRVSVLKQIAEDFAELGKVVEHQGRKIDFGSPRQYSKATQVSITVQVDEIGPLELSIYDAGDLVAIGAVKHQ